MTPQPDQPSAPDERPGPSAAALYGALGIVLLSVVALITAVATVGGLTGFIVAMGLLCVVIAVPALVIFRAPRR